MSRKLIKNSSKPTSISEIFPHIDKSYSPHFDRPSKKQIPNDFYGKKLLEQYDKIPQADEKNPAEQKIVDVEVDEEGGNEENDIGNEVSGAEKSVGEASGSANDKCISTKCKIEVR